MSYCLNPNCSRPDNPESPESCQACGTPLRLQGRYLSHKVLGRGGFGTTFLAVDCVLPGNPGCVIKQLRPVATAPHVLEMARELFHREAATLGKIGSHPQLPRLLDFFESGNEFYLVQEYVAGSTLQQQVRRGGVFDEPGVRNVLEEVLPILDYLHANEVIHRDIKPANLIRRSIDDKLVLIDFGAVKDKVNEAMAANPEEHSTLTAFAVGTPGFAPPEQMAMRPVYASDIYALGVTCIYLLTGKSPRDLGYDQKTGELNWRQHVKVGEYFGNILAKMLESSVRHRFQSAKELLQALSLEPQMQQLAQSIAAAPPAARSRVSQPVNSGSFVSPAARSAVAIRSQQARTDAMAGGYRRTGSAGNVGGAGTRSGYSPRTGPGNDLYSGDISGGQSQLAARTSNLKFDAPRLVAAYRKGRRDFTSQVLNNLVLRHANLPEAIFHQAQMQNVDLQQANLYNCNLGRASLSRSNLRDANLTKAYLSYADLSGTDLRGANLTDAYLNNANLRGANLCGANLLGASITEDQLAQAHINFRTTLPNGKRVMKL